MARDKDGSDHDDPDPPAKVPSADADGDIVELVRAGEHHRAQKLLMDRHGKAIYRYVRNELDDATAAADVQQRVFIAANKDLPKFAERSAVRTWLFAVARNRILDYLKSKKREQQRLVFDDTIDAPDAAPPLDDRLDDNRLHAALTECVRELPDQIRTPVLLRYVHGFSFEQIGEICKEKPGTIQARVARAMDKLRRCITLRTGDAT